MHINEFRPTAKKKTLVAAVSSACLMLASQYVHAVAPPSYTISANTAAPYDISSGTSDSVILVLNGVTISGSTITGALTNEGTIVSLINRGLLTSGYGVTNTGTITTFDNQDSVVGTGFSGIYNELGFIGTLANEANSTISGNHTGIRNTGDITALYNSGDVHGTTFAAIDNTPGTIGSITNTGMLEGGEYGIYNATLSGVSGSIGLINNEAAATITGGQYGIYNEGVITSITNAGEISGSIAAIYNAGTIGALNNSGVIEGNIVNSTNPLTITGGTGTIFGTLTGYNGTPGTITTSSDLYLASGNILLNDAINAAGQTVWNTSAVLEVDSPTTITGHYYQYAASTLLVGVTDSAAVSGSATDTGYGRLVVSGNTTMESGSTIELKSTTGNYAFAAGQRFVVVDTAGTATYNAGSLQYSVLGQTGTLTATGSSVTAGTHTDLVVTLGTTGSTTTTTTTTTGTDTTGDTASAAPTSLVAPTTANARNAVNGLNAYTGVGDAALLNLFNASIALQTYGSVGEVNRAGAQLAPISQASTARAAAAPTYNVLDIVSTHLDGLRLAQNDGASGASGVSTGEGTLANGVWGQAFGGHASQDARDSVDGYSANFAGMMFGMDRAVSDAWRLGGVVSYTNSAINNTGDTAGDTTRVNSYGLMGYGSYTASRWYANLSGGAVLQRYDANRQIGFSGYSGDATARFGGAQYIVRGELGMPLAAGQYTVTPLAALTYSYLHQNGYTESGGNGAALTVGGTHSTSVKSDLGAKLSRDFSTSYGVIVPQLTLAWRHEYDNTRTSSVASYAADPTGETSFTTLGSSPVSDLADVTLGVTLLRASNLSLNVRYEVQAGKGYVAQAGSVKLRQLF